MRATHQIKILLQAVDQLIIRQVFERELPRLKHEGQGNLIRQLRDVLGSSAGVPSFS